MWEVMIKSRLSHDFEREKSTFTKLGFRRSRTQDKEESHQTILETLWIDFESFLSFEMATNYDGNDLDEWIKHFG